MLCGSALLWSGNFIIGRAFATEIPPITLSYWRWFTALAIFLPFSFRYLIRDWHVIRANLVLLTFMGILGVAGFNTFVYLGLQQTTATNALLINSFIPILIILLSRIKPGISFSAKKLVGIVVSTAGMIMLVTHGSLGNLLAFRINQGDLWILLAAFIWATYSISLQWRPAELSAAGFLLFSMIIGVLVLSPFYWLNIFEEPALEINMPNLMGIGYIAIFASIGAFLLWNQGVKLVGAGTAGQFIHLMPVFGTVLAVLFLGEQLFWYHIAGAIAIGSGIFLSLRSPNKSH